jgi:GDSL-like Lipase/Acylhydrolase family
MWRSLTRYHPRIGYTYLPELRARVRHESGGYLVRTNAAGFRCAHELGEQRVDGRRRVLVFGDSMTAGDGVSNPQRFSDRLEHALSDVEVFNFGLPGTGPDQHYLAYQDFAANLDHDLLVIAVYVENIVRVVSRYRPYTDEHGAELMYAKPWYRLDGERLVLDGVPVPKAPLQPDELEGHARAHVDRGLPFRQLRNAVKALGLRDLAQRVTKFQPVPNYDAPTNPAWLLLRAILSEWIAVSRAPVLLVPLPIFCFTEDSADPSAYQARFRELAADTGARVHDPLPDLRRHSPSERRGFRFREDSHFTATGHQAVADSLATPIRSMLARTERR